MNALTKRAYACFKAAETSTSSMPLSRVADEAYEEWEFFDREPDFREVLVRRREVIHTVHTP